MSPPGSSVVSVSNETEQIPFLRSPRGMLGHAALETAAWLCVLSLIALAFAVAGAIGFRETLDAPELATVTQSQRLNAFDFVGGVAGLAVIALFTAAGLLIPASLGSRLGSEMRHRLLAGAAVLTAISATGFVFVLNVWWGWLTAVFLGALVWLFRLVAPGLHRKPWRTAGIATVVLLVVVFAVEIEAGVGAGTPALRWVLLTSAVALVAAGILVLVSPRVPSTDADFTGQIPIHPRLLRKPVDIANPWACSVLFAVLGAVFVLSLPVIADYGFGPGAFAFMVAAALAGWAAGYEAGPTFAPGMSRPRLTAFALLAAGLLTVALGIIPELSGKAVLTGLVSFCVGVGVRAQNYDYSRRFGTVGGVVLALAVTAFAPVTELVISDATQWEINPTTFAYMAVGLIAAVLGGVAIFTFPPQGARGTFVDLVHAFDVPTDSPEQPGAPVAGSTAAGAAALQCDDSAGHQISVNGHSSDGAFHVPPARQPETGLFVAIEGPDGSGKSTQVTLLKERLVQEGFSSAIVTREPGGTAVGALIRHVVLDGEATAPRAEALLYAADRAQHSIELIGPALRARGIVITDRYIDSSLAYQGAGRQLGEDEVQGLSRWATYGTVPHLTLVLDVPPDVSAQRTGARGDENHLDAEGTEFRTRVRDTFLSLAAAQPDRYAVIDSSGSPAAIADEIWSALSGLIAQRVATGALVASHAQAEAPAPDSHSTGGAAGQSSGTDSATCILPAQHDASDIFGGHAANDAAFSGDEEHHPAVPVLPPHSSADDVLPDIDGIPDSAAVNSHDEPLEGAAGHTSGDGDDTDVLPSAAEVEGRRASLSGGTGSSAVPHAPAAGDDATTVLPEREAAGEEKTTVMPENQAPPRPGPREKLRAQAEIERRARERLREARRIPRRAQDERP